MINKQGFLKVALSILVALSLFLLGAASFWFYQEKLAKPSPSPSSSLPSSALPTVPSPDTTSIASAEPSFQAKSDLQMIREAFAEKYGNPVDEVNVNISKQSNPYASGGVNFSGEMGGGWFLAYKESDDKWIIVADGNGTVPCEAIDPYDFPNDMVSECWRESTGELETR